MTASYVAVAPAHLTPNIGPFETEDAVYAFCETETYQHDKHYRPAVIGGSLLPWPRQLTPADPDASGSTPIIETNAYAHVHTWANGFGIWHVRVPRGAASPLIAARKALRDQIQARESGPIRREIWMKPVRVEMYDDADTIVYREGGEL